MAKRVVVFVLCSVLISATQGAVERPYEVVTVLGSECSEFLNRPAADIRVMVYDAAADAWSPIPFQVDEFIEKSGVPNAKEVDWYGDGTLTLLDEIVFMAKDLKDKAADASVWPSDAASRNLPRYEVVFTDPVSGQSAYAYIYYSSSLPKSAVSYVTYRNDRVYGQTYGIAHHSDAASGFPDSLAVSGNDTDILENWRVRALVKSLAVRVVYQGRTVTATASNIWFWEKMKDYSITLQYVFINITLKATAFHDESRLLVKSGPVRVIRRHVLGIKLYNETIDVDDTARIPITTFYYPHYSEFEPAFSLALGDMVTKLETDFISFSQAFNNNSLNVKFYGNGFVSSTGAVDSLINNSPQNTIFKKDLGTADWPGLHWWGFSGRETSKINNASFITFCRLNGTRIAPNRAPALFYYDYKSDMPDNSSAPVYGDTGLRIYDWKKTITEPVFAIDMRLRNYYLAQNMSKQEMQAFFNLYSVPLTVLSSSQTYTPPQDKIPPTRIADLRVIAVTDTSASLAWTAPYDDGDTGGPVGYYVIRYSPIPPMDPPGGFDWNWWGAPTTLTVLKPPPPAQPGTTQTFTISGLSPANFYYFRMNVVDKGGNTSGLSNVASITTTPVELASFSAQVLPSRQVLLQWVTESETDNLGFQLQRRRRDRQEWTDVAFIPGFGTTVERHVYTYSDAPGEAAQWHYRLLQTDRDGSRRSVAETAVTLSAPTVAALLQNYPNPFNPATAIAYEIPANVSGRVTLSVYDLLGRQVRTLVDEEAVPGYFTVSWDGRDDAGRMTGSGVYIYMLRVGDFSAAKKMIKVQ